MQTVCLSITTSSAQSLACIRNNHLQLQILNFKTPHSCTSRIRNPTTQLKLKQLQPFPSSFAGFNPLRVFVDNNMGLMNKKRLGSGAICSAGVLTPHNLQWISAISTAILMVVRGTAIQKSFLVPLLALQSPSSVVLWIKGEYGIWTAFLALLFRLFFYIPGELELPFMALLLIIVSPCQVMDLRGRKEGVVIGLVIAAFLAFQHYSRAGSLQKAFEQGSIVASLAIICIVAVPCFLLF